MITKISTSWKLIGVSFVMICVLFVALFWSWIPISNELQWTCAKTGAQKGRQVYLGFIQTGDYYRTSGLERLLIEAGHTNINHEWVKTQGTERYILVMTRSHSRAPASYHFNNLYSAFMRHASEEQKQHMTKVFLEGPEDARNAFLREAGDIAFGNAEPEELLDRNQPIRSATNENPRTADFRR